MTEMPSAGRTSGSLNEPIGERAASLGQLILDRVERSGAQEAFRAPDPAGGWRSFTWAETLAEASEAAAGLVALGVDFEDRVGIISNTRLHWILADYAIMLSGGATTAVYPSTGVDDVGFILGDSDCVVVIAEDQSQVDKALQNDLPDLRTFVVLDGEGNGDTVITWQELRDKGRDLLASNANLIQERVDGTNHDSLATLIYTSGTTGKPKGVELTHGNWTYEAASMAALNILRPTDVQFLWLPLAHSFGKVLTGAHLQVGGVIAVDGDIKRIVTNLPEVAPDITAMVPRLLEKINAGVIRNATAEGGAKTKIFNWAFAVGKEAQEKQKNGEAVGGLLGIKLGLADKLVFSKVRARLGGNLRVFISGSAALSADLNDWFDIVGMPILEGYGLTETSAATTVNRPDSKKSGTVGQPLPGTEIKIADDGEILVRGPGVMRKYRNRPDATAEVFGGAQKQGVETWFATGDIGVIDDAGRIKITDRKKDLVKTSGGKYIAPGAIEAQFKAKCPLAGAVVVIANDRNFASALIGLDVDAVKLWADTNGKSGATIEQLSSDEQLRAAIQSSVDDLNSGLNKWETIKQFRVLPKELTVDGGELTPSLKVKRKVVETEYAGLIDEIYSGGR
jgi:long-chain acyl-CoA synthetase